MIFKNQKEKKDARRATICAGHHAYMFRPIGAKVEFECVTCGHKLTVDA